MKKPIASIFSEQRTRFLFSLLIGLFMYVSADSALGQVITGSVADAETGLPLISANILVLGTAIGSATDTDGSFEIRELSPGTYTLRISFIGYAAQESVVRLEAGQTYVLNVVLIPGTDLDPVQVTAGRRNEKTLDAPTAIEVLTTRDFELDVAQSIAKSLRNVTGLDIVQTGVDRYEIVLRGFNNVFSRTTYVLTDYRKASAPSIGANLHSVMPALAIDTERIEVVRGPGSALYGPGVDSGVIHYFSKDAFNHPGVSVSVSGGQQSMFNVQGRAATVLGKNLGLKLVGSYSAAEDFALQDCDPLLLKDQRFSECPDPEDAVQLYVDGPRDTKQRKTVLNASMDWRMSNRTTLSMNVGVGNLNGTLLSSIGTVQAKEMIATHAQVRLSSGSLFVQAYLNSIDSKNSYIYGGGLVGESSDELAIQAQYTKAIGSRQEFIAGADLTLEEVDKFGTYVQSTTKVLEKLELVVALRGDYNNVVTDIRLSPRVALVLKPTPSASFRATYNRSFSSPLSTDYFLNLVAASLGDLIVRARGGASGFTYVRNPEYVTRGAPSELVASSMLPGMEGAPMPVGIETGVMYELMYEALIAIPDLELAQLLANAGLSIPPILIPTLKEQLSPQLMPVEGFSPGTLATINLSTLELMTDPELSNLEDLDPITPAITQSWEVGYKGILNRNILFNIDGYYARRRNFLGPLQIKTPFVLIPELQQDLIRDISVGLTKNSDLANLLTAFGLTPTEAAEQLVSLAANDLPDAETPIAIVQPNENNNGVGQFPELMLTYPNFGNIQYFGMDISLQILAGQNLLFFGNASWVSDDYFDQTETNEKSKDLELALNAPSFKWKLGGRYHRQQGLSIMASARFTKGFPVIAGQYVGDVGSYTVVDVGLGYAMSTIGIRVDLGIHNLLGSDHREFVGSPRLGRVANLRLTYTSNQSTSN